MIFRILLGFFSILACSGFVLGSKCTTIPASKQVDYQSVGANESVVYSTIHKVRVFQGGVFDMLGEPMQKGVIDVYKVRTVTKNPYDAVRDAEPFASFRVNGDGRFCVDLEDGNYVLRTGTTEFAFKHHYIWVKQKSSYRKRHIEVLLEPGT